VADEAEGSRPSVGEMLGDDLIEGGADSGPGLPAGIGLALIEGLVDDVAIVPRTDGTGTCVRMSWPILGDLLLPDVPVS
jgi:hypothetical protein